MERSKIVGSIVHILCICTIVGLFCSCELLPYDGDHISSYITELATIWTDSEGNISIIQNDKDERFIIADTKMANRIFIEASPITTRLTPDTPYRMICYYEKNGSMAQFLGMSYTLAKRATLTSEFGEREIIQDPVEVQSIWISGGYLNIMARINVLDKQHELFSIKQSYTTKHIFGLYHDSHKDDYGYFRSVCISIPLSGYDLNKGDTVFFRCNGYNKEYNYSLVY